MRFLLDRCAGRRLADWLRREGHDVVDIRDLAQDPGDAALLRMAHDADRILVTLDNDFGTLVHLHERAHTGLIRLPDVPSQARIELMTQILTRHAEDRLKRSVVAVRGNRIRISGGGPG